MNKTCLIVTSCIYPFSTFVKLNDPEERESLHVEALKRWINESTFESIIICDNSNYVYSNELVELALLKGKKLEVLTFKGDHINGFKYGKGFGEGEIMKFIIENSNLIKYHDSFFKVTGKLFVKNYYSINNVRNFDFIFSSPLIFFNSKQNVELVFTNFYYAKIESFKQYLIDSYLNVRDNDGVYLEHVYAEALKRGKKNRKKLKVGKMSPIPIMVGKSGSTGDSYSTKQTLKTSILNILLKTFVVKKLC